MNEKTTISEEFLDKAQSVLSETEQDLAELANAVLLELESPRSDQENGYSTHHTQTHNLRLQQLSQQFLRLSEQAKILRRCLQDNSPFPANDAYWSQIRILQSQEEERTQLARELEDSVGQLLANTIFELASSRHLLDGQNVVTEGLDALQAELEQGLTDVRHFIANLEPATILSNFGLAGGIRRYLEQYQVKTGLKTQLLIKTNIGRLPSIMETAIFRIIQESLSNVHLHAAASQVDVVVEEKEGVLNFSVIDDGIGLMAEKLGTDRKNLGLARMVDYAELLGGKLSIHSEANGGTQVTLVVPYPTL